MNFFTRIDYMTLKPGNKTAGFFLAVAVSALKTLSTVTVTEEERARLLEDARTRVRRAELIPDTLVDGCGFELLTGGVPRYFWVDRMFSGSLGANPDDLDKVSRPDQVEWLGDELSYSPHNVDAPKQALVLMILVQTWAEWAWGKILVAEHALLRQEKENKS